MKAMVLAAGLGTRLRPLTDDLPKALVEIAGRTLLEITLARLRAFGVREVIINAHHLAGMIVEHLKANDNFGLRVEVSHEETLLDTGGGLKKAAHFFLKNSGGLDEPFILHNVDVISSIDLGRMVQFHAENRALVTLAVQERDSSRYLLFDEQLRLCGRRTSEEEIDELARSGRSLIPRQTQAGASANGAFPLAGVEPGHLPRTPLRALGFCGIHVISSRLFAMMPEENIFSIIACYLQLAARGERIHGFPADEYYWRDLGTPENIRQAAEDLKR